MVAPYNPPIKNQDFRFPIALRSYADPAVFLTNPTLASGDVQLSKDGAAFANLTTLPSVSPASSGQVRADLTATEMNADEVMVRFKDQTSPPEWIEEWVAIITTT